MVVYGARRYAKHYVEVLALHRIDCEITPLEIIWDDGRRFAVELLAAGNRTRCDKTDGFAILHKVRLATGATRNLYRDNQGWFVETLDRGAPRGPTDPRLGDLPA